LIERSKKSKKKKPGSLSTWQTEQQRLDLSRKVGLLVVNEFQSKSFAYDALQTPLSEHLIADFDREYFNLASLAINDPRRAKPRGGKQK